MPIPDLVELGHRFKRVLMLVDAWGQTISSPPKKRSFDSEMEIQTILLEADELLCMDIRQSIGHPWASSFFTQSSPLTHGDAIPKSDAPVHKVAWSTESDGTYQLSEESFEADIIEAVKDYTLYGAEASDAYGYHKITQTGILLTTSPFVKVIQAQWSRTNLCQSPQSYSSGILVTAVALAFRDSIDIPLVSYCDRKSVELRTLIRQGIMRMPEVSDRAMEAAAQ